MKEKNMTELANEPRPATMTEADFTVKWLKNDLKVALANAPSPLTTAIGIYKGSDFKVIGLVEGHNAMTLVERTPREYTALVLNSDVFFSWNSETGIGYVPPSK